MVKYILYVNLLAFSSIGWIHVTNQKEGINVTASRLLDLKDGLVQKYSENKASNGDVSTIKTYCFDTNEACIYKHNHTHSYLNYSATYHKAFCACGQYELKPHQIDRTSEFKKGAYTYALCIDCKRLINTTADSGMLASMGLDEGAC